MQGAEAEHVFKKQEETHFSCERSKQKWQEARLKNIEYPEHSKGVWPFLSRKDSHLRVQSRRVNMIWTSDNSPYL